MTIIELKGESGKQKARESVKVTGVGLLNPVTKKYIIERRYDEAIPGLKVVMAKLPYYPGLLRTLMTGL